MKKISIVMPVYGVEKYIANSVRSICRQTNENFELILVDDGCRDNSIQIAREVIEEENATLTYKVYAQQNSGLSSARNSGIREAEGEWVICIDSDDTIHPDTVLYLLNCIEKYGSQYDLIWFDYKIVKDHTQVHNGLINKETNEIIYSRPSILESFLTREKKLIVPAVLVKKSFIYRYNLWYLESCKYSEDALMIWEYLYASNGICYIEEKLYSYLHRPGSIMTSAGIEKIKTGYSAFEQYTKELIVKDSKDEIAKMILPRWVFGTLHAAPKMMNYLDFKNLTREMDYRRNVSKLLGFADIKIVLLTIILLLSRPTFYRIAKRV